MPKLPFIIFSSVLLFACASNEKTEPEQCPIEPLSTNVGQRSLPINITKVREAIFSTQSNNLHTDNVKLVESYRLQKKLGELLAGEDDLVGASNAYQLAVEHLKQLREMADIKKPSQDDLKTVHYRLVDILLQRVETADNNDNKHC